MRKRLLMSLFVAWCAAGCTSDDPSANDPALQGPHEAEPTVRCEIVCASYDSTECREVCGPTQSDASVLEDPYAAPPPVPGDAGVAPQPHDELPIGEDPPIDPYAATDRRSRDHQAC